MTIPANTSDVPQPVADGLNAPLVDVIVEAAQVFQRAGLAVSEVAVVALVRVPGERPAIAQAWIGMDESGPVLAIQDPFRVAHLLLEAATKMLERAGLSIDVVNVMPPAIRRRMPTRGARRRRP